MPPSCPRAEAIVTRLHDGNVTSLEPAMSLRWLFFWLVPSGWKDTALDGKHFRHAAVTMDPVTNIPVVQIAFDTEGARLFAELTKKNVGKRIAIYVGGSQVTAPRVNEEITGGTAVISGNMNVQEAQELAQDLNTGAIPAPIHLTGQYTIEATLGDAALQTSMLAGFIGIVIVMLYMMFLYRLLGVVANMALVVYAFLLFAILKLPPPSSPDSSPPSSPASSDAGVSGVSVSSAVSVSSSAVSTSSSSLSFLLFLLGLQLLYYHFVLV
jgi:protein-export membrane protein SecD